MGSRKCRQIIMIINLLIIMFFPTYLWTYPVQMILSPSTMTPLTPPCFEESVEIQDQINFPVKNYKFIGKIFLSFVQEKQEGHIMAAKSERSCSIPVEVSSAKTAGFM